MSEKNFDNIPASAFEFVPLEGRMHDKKLESKPISYFRDAFNRFCRNKSSVVAAVIILLLILYAIIVPELCETNYSLALTDTTYLNYTKLPPKIKWLGIDAVKTVTVNETEYNKLRALEEETGLNPIVEVIQGPYQDTSASNKTKYYDLKVSVYDKMGMTYLTLTPDQYEDLQAWQNQSGIQVIYPAITDAKQTDANIWYQADKKGAPKLDKDGNLQAIYRTTTTTDTSYHSIRVAADNNPEAPLAYARVTGTSSNISYV